MEDGSEDSKALLKPKHSRIMINFTGTLQEFCNYKSSRYCSASSEMQSLPRR